MFFELQIALQYLIPRRGRGLTSLVAWLSISVISLVVWLVLVFLSVTKGMEVHWLRKLTSLHAPIRIAPSEHYYRSYYYLIDSLASSSNFVLKTLGEKHEAPRSDPYLSDCDPELPLSWPPPDYTEDGALRDPVKKAFALLQDYAARHKGVTFQEYEMSGALLRIATAGPDKETKNVFSQMVYLLSMAEENPYFAQLLTPETRSALITASGKVSLSNCDVAYPIFLPKYYQESGVHAGDRGYLGYSVPSAFASQEQRLAVEVVGFYDPGILTPGAKCILAPPQAIRTISLAHNTFSPDGTPTNGIFMWIPDIGRALSVVGELQLLFEQAGIAPYWELVSFENFTFAKGLLAQFQSDRLLLMAIATLILLIACCHVISLLILLTHDKRKEVAILQTLGAKRGSVIAIFGLSGLCIGIVSCCLGVGLSLLTMKNLDSLVGWMSVLQGRALLSPALYGTSLPTHLSREALFFVLIVTPLFSLLAGLVPAWRVSCIQTTQVLRGE